MGEMDLTLVAFYGSKTDSVAQLVETLQTELRSHLGAAFSAYELEQVHGTIVGLEGRRAGTAILNTNLSHKTGEPRAVNLGGLLRFLIDTPHLPLRIRIGGFDHSRAYPFDSRGFHPYFRSFALRGPVAVAIGWPVEGDTYPMALDALRRQCTDYNVLCNYHKEAGDIDNDFFFVLGRVDRESVTKDKAESLQNALRQLLSEREPLDIVVGRDQLSIVAYVDTQLPVASSVRYSLVQALAEVEELKRLYREQDPTH